MFSVSRKDFGNCVWKCKVHGFWRDSIFLSLSRPFRPISEKNDNKKWFFVCVVFIQEGLFNCPTMVRGIKWNCWTSAALDDLGELRRKLVFTFCAEPQCFFLYCCHYTILWARPRSKYLNLCIFLISLLHFPPFPSKFALCVLCEVENLAKGWRFCW